MDALQEKTYNEVLTMSSTEVISEQQPFEPFGPGVYDGQADSEEMRQDSGGVAGMEFHSVLSEIAEDRGINEAIDAPVSFADLNLDQIIDTLTKGKQEYNLKPFYYTPLNNADAIRYRQEIAQDLENGSLLAACRTCHPLKHEVLWSELSFEV